MKYSMIKLFLFACSVLFLVSCVNTRSATNFYGVKDSTVIKIPAEIDQIIQKNDLLSITVASLNPEATSVFNVPNYGNTVSASNTTQPAAGYLVDKNGNILFPILGPVQAAGLTKEKLKESITQKLISEKLLVEPIVNVRYLNFRVTVLGEVGDPKVVQVTNERISVPEALGMAGDLTIYAKRDNVMLLREENGNRIARRLDLNSPSFLSSPFYLLRSGDVLYVEPNKAKVSSATRTTQYLPVIFSALSILAIVLDRVIK